MNIYETIISILDEKGPLSIPLICQEVNQLMPNEQMNIISPSQIKSIVTRKKDVFRERKGNIYFAPDKYPYSLIAILEGDEGITYQVNINFMRKSFSFFEWRNKGIPKKTHNIYPRNLGNFDEFKREVMAMKIWEWRSHYGTDVGVTLGKTNWTIKLKTKSKTYMCEGTDCFPEQWAAFRGAIEKFAGVPFVIY